jgi:PAS domain S-box-containing protein
MSLLSIPMGWESFVLGALLSATILFTVWRGFHWMRRRRRSALRATDYYRLIAQATGDVAFEYDHQTDKFNWTSDLGADLLGYLPGEIHIDHELFNGLVHEDDREEFKKRWELLKQNTRVGMEFRLRHKDGQWHWLHMDAVPQTRHDHRVVRSVGVIRRTQEYHNAQDALAEARRLETIGTMAGGIAHEFNNHLTPIRGYLELALDELDPDHPSVDGLRTALDRVEYCADLVAQIQAYGRKSVIVPKPADLARLLPGVIRMALSLMRESSGTTTLAENIPETLPSVMLDQRQFQQAMVHLIRNGIEAMPRGGVLKISAEEVYVHKQHAARHPKSGRFICINVVDTGEGILPEHQPHIFDPFFTTRGRARARGMGLPMVQGMVAQHDGWIEIQSKVGVGTHVRMYLPVMQAPAGAAAATVSDRDGTMAVLPAAPVGIMLVADDEESIRDIVRRVFQKEGWRVEEAENGTDAVSRFSDRHANIDVLVLDLTMPGPPAEDSIRLIKGIRPDTRILLMSGYARDERVDKLHQSAGVEFISKPFSPKEILSRVDEMMAETLTVAKSAHVPDA